MFRICSNWTVVVQKPVQKPDWKGMDGETTIFELHAFIIFGPLVN